MCTKSKIGVWHDVGPRRLACPSKVLANWCLTLVLFTSHCVILLGQSGFDCATPDDPGIVFMGGAGGACIDAVFYTPDASNNHQNTPNLVFKLNYHFFRPLDGSGPYAGNMTTAVVAEVDGINYYNSLLLPPTIPTVPPAEELTDARVRFELAGVFYHDDNAYIDYSMGVCAWTLENTFGVDADHVINIFYYTDLDEGSVGCGPGPFVNMQNCYPDFNQSLIRHELGHVIGLPHTYACGGLPCSDDVFSDTYSPDCNTGWANPGLSEPWTHPATDPCQAIGTGVTNNVMGYNSGRRYYSPQQLAQVQRRSITLPTWRNYVICTPSLHNPTIAITQSAVWEASKIINANIEIEPGVVLDVRCTLYMSPPARIIVKQGGKLIVDGGLITAHTGSCVEFWPGIEVWGNSNEHQYGSPSMNGQPAHQGMVVLKNGAVIEHAREAITLWKDGDWSSLGGVVQVQGTAAQPVTFLNCRRAITFMAYQNFFPGSNVVDEPRRNRSYFRYADFIVDDDYRGVDDFYAHVSMWKVDGINFIGCNFTNAQTAGSGGIEDSDKLGHGIISLDAQYRVLPGCDVFVSHGDECQEADLNPSTFTGLDHGIHAMSSPGGLRGFEVHRATFTNNICGVYTSGVVGAKITRNKFVLGNREVTLTNPDELSWNGYHRGTYSYNSFAFLLDDNIASMDLGATASAEAFVVGYSRDHNDFVFRNEATGVERAYIGEGVCSDPDNKTTIGLQFLCNENDGNQTDIWNRPVVPDPNNPPEDHTVRLIQGGATRPAGNTFDRVAPTPAEGDLRSDNTFNVINYRFNAAVTDEDPIGLTDGYVTKQAATTIPANYCGSKLLGPIPEDPDDEVVMLALNDDLLAEKLAYGNTRYLYDQLIDGGSHDEVVLEIMNSWPEDAWELRAYLLGLSPYLSTGTLKDMVGQAVLPDAMVTEICVANPDATRQDGFLEWLQEESGHPLPEYMAGLIVASWEQHTYRSALETEMAGHHGDMTQAANAMLQILARDTLGEPLDSMRTIWQVVRTPAARYAEALTYMQQGEFASATAVVESIPEEHDLRDPEELERQRMLAVIDFFATIHDDDRNEAQLTVAEQDALEAIIDDAYDRPAWWAQNVLCFFYDRCRSPLTGGPPGELQSLHDAVTPSLINAEPRLTVMPNPAATWVAFTFDLLHPSQDAWLLIRDISGREVHRVRLNAQQGQVLWDARQVVQGAYTIEMVDSQRILQTRKLILRP